MSKSSRELVNSWWLILPFTFPIYLNWTAFIYIGITARYRKWILYGVVYAIPGILITFLGSINSSEVNVNSMGILVIVMYLMGSVSIIHAFSLREEYFIRSKTLNKQNDDNLRKKIFREYGLVDWVSRENQGHSTTINDEKKAVSNEFDKNYPTEVGSQVDINNDPEDLLVEIPGVSVILAKKAIKLRESGVYFDSAEDFCQALGLKPHMVEKIKPFIVINPSGEEETIIKNKGRILDI